MKQIALFILLMLSQFAFGAHLVGGEISYTCNGNNNYTIKLKVYRDCNSAGAPFDPNASIAIYNGNSNFPYTTLDPTPSTIVTIPVVVNNPCLQTPPNICTQLATYTATVNLPPTAGGYVISYQRCCRNQTISNIPNPGTWGSTYTTRIPPNDVGCNSSPSFQSNPPIVLCTNDPLNINSAATESDGDSLYYEFCSPLHGGDQLVPRPVPADPPPYAAVPFLPGFSPGNPITSNPSVQINPNTGLITGKPTQTGQFVVAICVSEYRNGILLCTVRRDYQFNVTNCQSNVVSSIASDTLFCTGKSVSFASASINGTKYFWDFGDPMRSSDSSNNQNPSYTYVDTGTYNVMLIVNKGWPCSDTVIKTIHVHYPANASFSFQGAQCLNNGAVTFTPTSNNAFKDQFSWDFGPAAAPSNSNSRFPPPIVFNTAGNHVVSLTVNSFGCIKTVYDTVKIYEKPTIGFSIPKKTGCAPFTVNFSDSSMASTKITYEWDFGDGNSSTSASPSHTYTNPGSYSVYLRIYTTEGCIDTLEIFRPNYITVNPSPTSSAAISPVKTNIYDAVVEVEDLAAELGQDYFTDMDDGSVYYNTKKFLHQYIDTGTYNVMHVVTNEYGCADTLITLVRINPEPLIFAPNAFTPNGDGENDIYLPSIVGAIEYEFIIFSRWGDVVFRTTNTSEGWNGNDQNVGSMLPVGVYTFTIHVRDINMQVANKKGYITLFR